MMLQMLATVVAFAWVSMATRQHVSSLMLRLVTCNDDWASAGSNLLEVLRQDPDAIFIQEGKREVYARLRHPKTKGLLLPSHTWLVQQNSSNPAIKGSVVIVRRDSVGRLGQAGFTFAVKAHGLLGRYIAWVRAGARHHRLFLFSAHRPPIRARHWWRPFDLVLWVRLRAAMATGRIVIGGMDSNEHGGPGRVPKGLKWVAVGNSIDGFILPKGAEVLHLHELPKGTSDHHPVMCETQIPLRRVA